MSRSLRPTVFHAALILLLSIASSCAAEHEVSSEIETLESTSAPLGGCQPPLRCPDSCQAWGWSLPSDVGPVLGTSQPNAKRAALDIIAAQFQAAKGLYCPDSCGDGCDCVTDRRAHDVNSLCRTWSAPGGRAWAHCSAGQYNIDIFCNCEHDDGTIETFDPDVAVAPH